MPLRQQLAETVRRDYRSPRLWIHGLLFACLGLAFWPMTRWLAATATDQSRILHALVVLLLAAVFLVRFGGVRVIDPLRLNSSSRCCLVAAFGLLAAPALAPALIGGSHPQLLGWLSLLSIPAYCFAIAALVLFVFGEGARRVTATVAATFGVFILLSLLMDPLDWPLRTLAGEWSGAALAWIGKSVELGLVPGEKGPPMLIMVVAGYPFHVASECNGFGVILTSLLLAFLLAVYRRLRPWDFALNIAAGLFLGFTFNILRICIIVLLAPHMMPHYDLMHEIVGGVTFWGCLVLVWILLNGPTRDEPSSKVDHSSSAIGG